MATIRTGLLGLLFSSLAAAAFADHPDSPEPSLFSPLPEVFFGAPAGFALHDYSNASVAIGHSSAEGGITPLVDVNVVQGHPEGETADFETFALAAIRNTCAADGPDGTIFCDAVRQRQPFTSDSGVYGEILYLDRVHESWNPDSQSVEAYGPIFLFDLSDKTAGDTWIALVVQPSQWLEVGAIDDGLLLEVARTVEAWTGPIEY